MRSCPAVPVALLAAALACGKNAEEERFERVRATCEALVGRTIADAQRDLGWVDQVGSPGALGACGADLAPWNGRDTCRYDGLTVNCDGGWNYWATDPGLCDGAGCVWRDGACQPVRCWYGCLIRTSAEDAVAHATDLEIPICASRFVSGEPNPPAR